MTALIYGADGTVAVKAAHTKANPDRLQGLLVEVFGLFAGLYTEDDIDALGGVEEIQRQTCRQIIDTIGPEALEARFEGLAIERIPEPTAETPDLVVTREGAPEVEA